MSDTTRNKETSALATSGTLSERISRRSLLGGAAGFGLALPAGGLLLNGGVAMPAIAQSSAAGKFDLEPIIEGAKKEGAVIAAGNAVQASEARKALADAFRKKYGLPSSFGFEFVVKPIGQMQKQVEDEIAADKVSLDVIAVNVLVWAMTLAKRGKLVAFDTPEYDAYDQWKSQPNFVNRPYYVSDPTITWNIAWNTDIIKDNEFGSWFDLLRPEYKGKITVISARLSQSAAITYKAMRDAPAIGDAFFKKLAELEPVAVTLTDTAVVKIESGEYPITMVPSSRTYAAWKRGSQNLGQSFPKEGVVPLGVAWFLLANAPHPNAAKLLVNFTRSREGQQVLADYEGRIPGRADVKSPNTKYVPDVSKLKLLPIDESKITQAEFRKLGTDWKALFGT